MIKINLLRSSAQLKNKPLKIPFKVIITSLLIIIIAFFGGNYLYNKIKQDGEKYKVVKSERIVRIKKDKTPFDVVEDIVDDIHGGRFKIKSLNRLSSPANLSVNEKKIYEKFFVKNIFDVFNQKIKKGMGFNTINLDNDGNFFIYGLTPNKNIAREFREEIIKTPSVLKADALKFKKLKNEKNIRFALKGFLNYNIIEEFYNDDTWKKNEEIKYSKKTVLFAIIKTAKNCGAKKVSNLNWGTFEKYGAARKYSVMFQIESDYKALMCWINTIYKNNFQIGFARLNSVSITSKKILTAVEIYVYAKK